jgi:hypothetical protein
MAAVSILVICRKEAAKLGGLGSHGLRADMTMRLRLRARGSSTGAPATPAMSSSSLTVDDFSVSSLYRPRRARFHARLKIRIRKLGVRVDGFCISQVFSSRNSLAIP